MRSEERGARWARARDVLETLVHLQSPSGARIELGRVTHVGDGMFRDAYAAAVDVAPDANVSASMGDPAYDLAIVTRGVRRPFQVDGGLDRLLDAYHAACGSAARVTSEQIRVHELGLAAEWCKRAMTSDPRNRIEPVADAIARLRRVLAMARGAHSSSA